MSSRCLWPVILLPYSALTNERGCVLASMALCHGTLFSVISLTLSGSIVWLLSPNKQQQCVKLTGLSCPFWRMVVVNTFFENQLRIDAQTHLSFIGEVEVTTPLLKHVYLTGFFWCVFFLFWSRIASVFGLFQSKWSCFLDPTKTVCLVFISSDFWTYV